MDLKLEGKVVLITGGTGGIGSQIVADFLREGSIVACLIRNNNKFKDLKNKLESENLNTENLHAFNCDLLDYESINTQVNHVAKKLSKINVLVNCAGFPVETPFAFMDKSQIDAVLDLNIKSPMYLIQAVLKFMYKEKEGSIINISSISAAKKGRGITVYAAAKSALDTFSRTLAIEVGRKNIRINTIRPGVIDTAMSTSLMERVGDSVVKSTSLNRYGKPEEISKLTLCLASSNVSSFVTGESINVDGGLF